MTTDFTKLCKKLDDYFEEASTDQLEVIYYMVYTELRERDLLREKFGDLDGSL